ncbi:hypothetical protein ES703_61537 [subsurface metagenome]
MVKTKGKSNRRRKYNIVIMGRAYSPRSHAAAQYKDKVRGEALKVIDTLMEGDVSIRLDYFYTDSKSRLDDDNLQKIIRDGLKSVAYHDDSQITESHAYVYNLNSSFKIEDPPFPEIFDHIGHRDFVAITLCSI